MIRKEPAKRYFPKKQFLVVDGNEIKGRRIFYYIRRQQSFQLNPLRPFASKTSGADHHLTDENLQEPDTGLFCIRRTQTRSRARCLVAQRTDGQTAMSAPVEQVLKRFFRAIEADNAEVLAEMYPHWSRSLCHHPLSCPTETSTKH